MYTLCQVYEKPYNLDENSTYLQYLDAGNSYRWVPMILPLKNRDLLKKTRKAIF